MSNGVLLASRAVVVVVRLWSLGPAPQRRTTVAIRRTVVTDLTAADSTPAAAIPRWVDTRQLPTTPLPILTTTALDTRQAATHPRVVQSPAMRRRGTPLPCRASTVSCHHTVDQCRLGCCRLVALWCRWRHCTRQRRHPRHTSRSRTRSGVTLKAATATQPR